MVILLRFVTGKGYRLKLAKGGSAEGRGWGSTKHRAPVVPTSWCQDALPSQCYVTAHRDCCQLRKVTLASLSIPTFYWGYIAWI